MKTVSIELSEDELMWLEKIYSSRVKIANNMLERIPESLPSDFEKYYDLDKRVLEKVNKAVEKNET